jgi:NAD(P)-dependent dehydrogenase (short-subunit alcohol dehydrogenase family)
VRDFEDRVCVVTGAGSGIGRAAAVAFGQRGGRVVLVNRDPKSGGDSARAVEAAGGEALFVAADVGDTAAAERIVSAAVERFGRIDVLVNNAATMAFAPVAALTLEAWNRVLAVNLTAPFLLCKHALPHMPAGGAIVNVSSVHAQATTPDVAAYAASKGGLDAFTRVLALECSPRDIRVNSLVPGAVDTPMLWNNPNVRSGRETVEGRVGKPEDIAAAICFLASDAARFVTGSALVIDGGRLATL